MVSADIVLFEIEELSNSKELKVDMAPITGESGDLKRSVTEKTENIFESPNVCFRLSKVTSGKGKGIVFKTGKDTVMGILSKR